MHVPRPFEVTLDELEAGIDLYVDATYADLTSSFLVLPKGRGFVAYGDFQEAYERLKRATAGFQQLTTENLWAALREDSLTFLVIRTILGLSPPEWAKLTSSEEGVVVEQGVARMLDDRCRTQRGYAARLVEGGTSVHIPRLQAMLRLASRYIQAGAPAGAENTVHRLNKFDTQDGASSVRRAADLGVPYAVLLYERYLGRPFASHRDAVSELVGDVMESAIEERLSAAHITYRKTRRAERIPDFEQAPDFIVPDELEPRIVIEAKITNDDGTARDKVARLLRLAQLSDERIARGGKGFQVVACIDGRGFGVRREDMRLLLRRMQGKVFTLNTLDSLITHTRLAEFVSA